MSAENHTLKRALTDPRIIDGVGNAYSDEILHAARLSPLAMTSKLTPEEWERLFEATRTTLREWIDRLVAQAGGIVSGRRYGLSRRDGRSRSLRETVSALRGNGAAHSLCRQRDELLPALSDRRQSTRRPRSIAHWNQPAARETIEAIPMSGVILRASRTRA